jgi:hypothetical protein
MRKLIIATIFVALSGVPSVMRAAACTGAG